MGTGADFNNQIKGDRSTERARFWVAFEIAGLN